MPADPLPPADAVVSVGHVLSYLPDAAAVETALAAAADALRPGGVLAVDILDLDYGRIRAGERPFARVEEDWAIITEFSAPARIVSSVTPRRSSPTARAPGGAVSERHENVLVDTSRLPDLLAAHGVRASVGTSFGDAELPARPALGNWPQRLVPNGPGACPRVR